MQTWLVEANNEGLKQLFAGFLQLYNSELPRNFLTIVTSWPNGNYPQ